MSTVTMSNVGEGLPAVDVAQEPTVSPPRPAVNTRHVPRQKTWFDRLEAFISALSVRDNFWHRICSFLWLPLAFFSGIRMKKIDTDAFTAVLPFNRFNRNWYHAMAGAALLGNSEIAGGMYVFGVVGADYTVVCKHLDYKFLRPCLGPAVYKPKAREDISALAAHGGEFNVTLDLDVFQQINKPGSPERERRVGRAVITFHVTPKLHHKVKAERKGE